MGGNEITFTVYRETVWRSESKERRGEVFVLRNSVVLFQGPIKLVCVNVKVSRRDEGMRRIQITVYFEMFCLQWRLEQSL
jgi:hypothetical protein